MNVNIFFYPFLVLILSIQFKTKNMFYRNRQEQFFRFRVGVKMAMVTTHLTLVNDNNHFSDFCRPVELFC